MHTENGEQPIGSTPTPVADSETPYDSPETIAARAALVDDLRRDVTDARVLDALLRVPRHLFVPEGARLLAYRNHPVPIGYGQTISQPLIVGMMSEALELQGDERVLEIGTGCGYQAAVLSLLCRTVYSLEVEPHLAAEAKGRLARLGYGNVHVRCSDGFKGWPEEAPFDRIIVTAAPKAVPKALFEQLGANGRLVAPVGPPSHVQRLLRYRKLGTSLSSEDLGAVQFVPMVHGG